MGMAAQTLYDKLWNSHIVRDYGHNTVLLYIDRHLVQEVSSPQAFEGLKTRKLSVRRTETHLSVADHAIPTQGRKSLLKESLAARQITRLITNCQIFGISYIPIDDIRHGIVHVVGPETGFTLPGTTLVCGDSHTSTHGAFGCLAFGIGSSEIETVFTTQTLRQTKQKQMLVTLNGALSVGVSTKDIILALIKKIGTSGARNHTIEFDGPAIHNLSMEARMTLCNMSIEAGARSGLIAPDDVTMAYLRGRPFSPKGAEWDMAVAHWQTLHSDRHAVFDREITIDCSKIAPHVSWGTTPADCGDVTEKIPDPVNEKDPVRQRQIRKSLDYMGLKPNTPITDIKIDTVFIGSCTNSRIEDLRRSAKIIGSHKIAKTVKALVVPGSATVKAQAEAEGLDIIFKKAGFEWRHAGCSMCVAMNDDRLSPGERSASTSNRNFEGRQGQNGRTHLMSPEMAAAAAITGHITDVRQFIGYSNA